MLSTVPNRISDVLTPWAERLPEHLAVVDPSGAWSYRKLAGVVGETREWLMESGVRPGDRLMMVCENCRAFVALLLAGASLGAWPVLVNARLSFAEIEKIRAHCDPRLVIYTSEISPQAMENARRGNAEIKPVNNLGTLGISPLNHGASPEAIDDDPGNNVAALIYTSGTTGIPKGVMLTHRNLLFIAAASARIRSLAPDDRLYGVLPMSHAVGLSVVLLGSLLSGATVYLAPRFDPMTARLALEKDGITVLLSTPSMFNQFLQYAKLRKLEKLSFPKLRIIASCSAPLQAAVKRSVESLFGLVLHNGYGITECSPTIAQTRVEQPRSDLSAGPVLPEVEVKLVDSERRPAPAGEIGELWVRGPNVMKGYYRAPEETAAVIDADGWFNTCDLARLEDANLFVVGRSKDIIIRRGFNVYPPEVEAVLNDHPAVIQSAVIGQTIPGDEEIIAFVQTVPAARITSAELSEHAARRLAAYKRPSQIVFVAAMPTTPTGKIQKNLLRAQLESNTVQIDGLASPIPGS